MRGRAIGDQGPAPPPYGPVAAKRPVPTCPPWMVISSPGQSSQSSKHPIGHHAQRRPGPVLIDGCRHDADVHRDRVLENAGLCAAALLALLIDPTSGRFLGTGVMLIDGSAATTVRFVATA